jgi:hypothetical protein
MEAFMNRRQFIDRLKAAGMETAALAIEQLPPTCVRFDTILADEAEIPIGTSKLDRTRPSGVLPHRAQKGNARWKKQIKTG